MPDPYRGDALDIVELAELADALDAAAKTNPVMHKALSMVLMSGGSAIDLVMVVAVITGRRLARHNVIPSEFDDRLGTFLAEKRGVPFESVNG
jgi:hypothetical protein